MRPVEEIRYDHIHGDASLLVASRHLKKLLLRLIAKLALPESEAVFRHHRDLARDIRVCLLNLCRSISRRDPVVELFGGLRHPLGNIFAECNLPDRRVVPQHAIAFARHKERNTRLGIPLGKFHDASLQVKERLLILAHSEQLLAVIRLEPVDQFVAVRAGSWLKSSWYDLKGACKFTAALIHGTCAVILLQKDFPLLVQKLQNAAIHDPAGQPSIDDLRRIVLYRYGGNPLFLPCRKKNAVIIRKKFASLGGSHPETVISPGFDQQQFFITAPEKPAVFFVDHVFLLSFFQSE